METTNLTPFNLTRWILLTVAGWFTGVVIIIGLGLITESTGLNLGGNSVVGIGMGAGVGWMQWLALKKHIAVSKNWIWFSIAAFTITYVVADILGGFYELKPETFLPFATALGALLSGLLQYQFILNKLSSRALQWIILSVIGWSLAHFFTMGLYQLKLDFLPRVVQITLAFSFLLLAAPVLGFITGKSMNVVLKSKSIAE